MIEHLSSFIERLQIRFQLFRPTSTSDVTWSLFFPLPDYPILIL